MSRFLKDTKKYYKYAIYSAKSKLQSEVASSYLNWLWWVLDPICFMLIYTLIFGVVFNAKEQYFTVFIFIGLTMWDFFNKTLQQSVKIVKNNKSIVAKVYLPKYILVMVRMFVNGFKMLISHFSPFAYGNHLVGTAIKRNDRRFVHYNLPVI